jgi:hypothetical protein
MAISAASQSGIAHYHLRNTTFQNTSLNAAHLPEGNLFIGLPVISGINFFYNNRLSYNELFTRTERGSILIDAEKGIENLGVDNVISTHVNVNLFHIGYRLPSGIHGFSLFANERIEMDLTFPRDLIDYFFNGNFQFSGERVDIGSFGLSGNHFREIGLGYHFKLPSEHFKFGARAKFYQGIFNASSPSSFHASLLTENQNLQFNLETENAIYRTAGLEIANGNQEGDLGSYLISNGNVGFGFDFGFDYKLNNALGISFAANDLGFISWKEGIKNRVFSDTTFRYLGVELKGARDIVQTVQDSLLDKCTYSTNQEAYIAPTVSSFITSVDYTPYPGTDVIATTAMRLVQGQPKMTYALGVRQYFSKHLVMSATAVKPPQQLPNLGVALSAIFGPLQFYLATDKVAGYNAPDMNWANFRVGLNLIFGDKEEKLVEDTGYDPRYKELRGYDPKTKGVRTNMFQGRFIRARKIDGIYTIIPRQKRRKVETATPEIEERDKN